MCIVVFILHKDKCGIIGRPPVRECPAAVGKIDQPFQPLECSLFQKFVHMCKNRAEVRSPVAAQFKLFHIGFQFFLAGDLLVRTDCVIALNLSLIHILHTGKIQLPQDRLKQWLLNSPFFCEFLQIPGKEGGLLRHI